MKRVPEQGIGRLTDNLVYCMSMATELDTGV